MINTIYKKGDIPNIAGYEFYAVMEDFTIKEDKVTVNEKGLHSCSYFKSMIGWLKLKTK